MSAVIRDTGLAINWRITLLGLNLAAWLAAALGVAILFVHHEMTQPPIYPGFGDTVTMFNDTPVFYPAKADDAPVVNLKAIGNLPQGALAGERGSSRRGLGAPERISKDPRALQKALQPAAH
jgi:hypothetical protein